MTPIRASRGFPPSFTPANVGRRRPWWAPPRVRSWPLELIGLAWDVPEVEGQTGNGPKPFAFEMGNEIIVRLTLGATLRRDSRLPLDIIWIFLQERAADGAARSASVASCQIRGTRRAWRPRRCECYCPAAISAAWQRALLSAAARQCGGEWHGRPLGREDVLQAARLTMWT